MSKVGEFYMDMMQEDREYIAENPVIKKRTVKKERKVTAERIVIRAEWSTNNYMYLTKSGPKFAPAGCYPEGVVVLSSDKAYPKAASMTKNSKQGYRWQAVKM